jgi:ATP-dependent Lon protease
VVKSVSRSFFCVETDALRNKRCVAPTVRVSKPKKIISATRLYGQLEKNEVVTKLSIISDSVIQFAVVLQIKENGNLHDSEFRLSNGRTTKIGHGFDIYQRPDDWLQIGANDLDLRPYLETNVDGSVQHPDSCALTEVF